MRSPSGGGHPGPALPSTGVQRQEYFTAAPALPCSRNLVAALTPEADVAFLYDGPSKWALQAQPPLATADGGADGRSYERISDAFYRGAFDAGLQARILHPGQLVDGSLPSVLVVPGFYAADDDTLDRLRAYAEAGGHLVLGPRTAYGDTEARARTGVQPARLAEAAGVAYDEFSNLSAALPVTGTATLPLPPEARALHWADGLRPQGAEQLATYEHPHFGRRPATTHRHGSGRITYVGTVPAPVLARALFEWAAPADPWRPSHPSVTSASATARDGRRVRFLHNWSSEPASVPVPTAVREVLADTPYEREVPLGPWDVKVLTDELPR